MAILQLGKSLKARLQDWQQAVKLRPGSNDKSMKVNADRAKRDRYMTKQGKQPNTRKEKEKKKEKEKRKLDNNKDDLRRRRKVCC